MVHQSQCLLVPYNSCSVVLLGKPFHRQHLCAVFYSYVLLLYVPHLLRECHLCLELGLPQEDLLLCLACLAHLPYFLGLQSHLPKVFVTLLCLKAICCGSGLFIYYSELVTKIGSSRLARTNSGVLDIPWWQTPCLFLCEKDSGEHRHFNLCWGIHCLLLDFLFHQLSSWQELTQWKFLIGKTSHQFPGKAWPHLWHCLS